MAMGDSFSEIEITAILKNLTGEITEKIWLFLLGFYDLNLNLQSNNPSFPKLFLYQE